MAKVESKGVEKSAKAQSTSLFKMAKLAAEARTKMLNAGALASETLAAEDPGFALLQQVDGDLATLRDRFETALEDLRK